MPTPISKEQIVKYYDNSEIDYKLLWNLNDSLALHYGYWDDGVKTLGQALERENEILANIANIKSTDTVLDAGCGVGGSSIYLAKKFGCRVIGITISQKQVDSAIENARLNGVSDKTEFIVMDFENMTFSDSTFDVVWAIESVCHANSKKKFIEDSFRVMKKGGRIVVADGFVTGKSLSDEEKNIMRRWLNGWGVNSLETKENFSEFLGEVGFGKISFMDITNNVLKSSKRLYRRSPPVILIGKMLELLGFRTRAQNDNLISARYQYKALVQNLWKYGIFSAEK